MPRERTHLRYQLYRSKARKLANTITTQLHAQGLIDGTETDLSRIRFEAIDVKALTAYSFWGEDSHFSWDEVVNWKTKEPMSFDLSIWSDLELCGLCFANPNQSRLRVKIVRLEGKPGKTHPLKNRIAPLALIAIEHYARIIGSRFIEIQEPTRGAVPIYKQLGFEFDAKGRLVMAVERD